MMLIPGKVDDTPVPDRLLEVFRGKRPMPLKLEIRPTNRCNLNCLHCWRQTHPKRAYENELPPERIVELIREGTSLGVKKVELVGGGEPTFDRSAAMGYVREIKRQGMYGDLVTNGTLFTEEMVREMVEFGWDRIMFSIDGANADTHDYIRGRKGVFEKAVRNIRLFSTWKSRLGLERPLLGLVPVLTNRNLTQFSDFIELAHSLGAYHVGFKPLVVEHDLGDTLRIKKGQFLEMNRHIEAAIPLAEKYGIDTNLHSIIHKPGNEVVKKSIDVTQLYREDAEAAGALLKKRLSLTAEDIVEVGHEGVYEHFLKFVQIPCYLPWIHLTITPEGDVVPCSGAGKLNPKPNVRDASLKEILFGDIFTRFRESLEKGEMPALCKGCCVGLFLDNRRFRAELIERGSHLLEKSAHG